MRRIGSVLVVCSLISLIWVSPAESCWLGRCCWGRRAACCDPCCTPCAAESVPVCGPAEAVPGVAVPAPELAEVAKPAPPPPEPKSPEEIAREVATQTAQEVAAETARVEAAAVAKDEATKAAAAAAQKEVGQLRSELQALEAKVNELEKQTPPTTPTAPTPPGAGPEVTPGEFQAPGQTPQGTPQAGAEETPETFQAPGGQMAPGGTQPGSSAEESEETFQAPGATAPANESSMLIIPPGTTYGNTRAWTDNTGRHHARARLAEVHRGEVRLQLEGGQFVTVPLERLSLKDLLFVWRSGWFGSPVLLTMADN